MKKAKQMRARTTDEQCTAAEIACCMVALFDSDHVPEVECCLHETAHLCLRDEVIDGIEVDIERRACSRCERAPMPSVVLAVEQDIRGHNGDTHGDHEKDEEHQKHEAVNVIETV